MTAAVSPPLHSEGMARSFLRSFVRVAFWPLFSLVVFGSMVWADALGFHDAARGLLALGTLLGVILIERIVPLSPAGIGGDPQLPQDLALFTLVGLTEALTYLTMIGAAVWLGAQLHSVVGVTIWPSHWPWFGQVLLAFLAADFLDYWIHRLSHRVQWLWSIHVHHHDTERLHVFKGARNHPLAGLTRVVGAYFPLLLVGAPPVLLFWFQTFIVSIGSVAHANLDMRFPVWLHRVLVTPPVHRVHHARARELHDRNFGALTPLWDILFGSYEPPERHGEFEFGVGDPKVPSSLLGRLAWPFVWWRAHSG